jgi:hypothetical protein
MTNIAQRGAVPLTELAFVSELNPVGWRIARNRLPAAMLDGVAVQAS